jgi:hypothetical protein
MPRPLVLFGVFTLVLPATGLGQSNQPTERRARAIANCEANRGTDCRSEAGLREWELLERSRAEAVREGSRRKPVPPPPPSPRPRQGATEK